MAGATAVMMAWGVARTAFWLDEGASVVATQRTWGGLWVLRDGAEAPLLPYYVLLKMYCAVAIRVAPGLAAHPEVLYRLPSVIVTVLAGGLLISWLRRFGPDRLVMATAAILLLTGGLSRYGQEARPYAAVLFTAVLCTVLWTVMISDPRRRWLVAYALAIAAMVALNTLSVGLLPAHLVAAVLCTEAGQRRTEVLRTTAAAVTGVLIVSPLALLTARNGTGPLYVYPDVTLPDAFTVFVRLFTFSDRPLLGAGSILLLAVVGLSRVNSGEFAFIARLAACWALFPPAVLMAVLLVHPNLLFERYVLFAVPGWAILAGLGVVTVADLGRELVTRVSGSGSAVPAAVAGVLALGLIVGVAVDQAQTQRQIRTLAGHGEDPRPALAFAVRAQYEDLPIVVSSRFGSVLVGAYAPGEEKRLVTQRIQRTETLIWPAAKPTKVSTGFLKRQQRVILLQRFGTASGCEHLPSLPHAEQIESCMPTVLRAQGYRVETVEPTGLGWAYAVLEHQTLAK